MPDTAQILNEISWTATRSSGKGGQHVNKVSTKVEARWHIAESSALTEEEKALVMKKLAGKINKEGWLITDSEASRSQLKNKETAGKKLLELVSKALIKPKKRIKTKTPRSVIEKRKTNKQMLSEKKEGRKKLR